MLKLIMHKIRFFYDNIFLLLLITLNILHIIQLFSITLYEINNKTKIHL